MSDDLSLLEQLKQQHAGFIAQRDATQTNLNQLIGAIYACDVMIKQYEEAASKPCDMVAECLLKDDEC